MKKVNSKVKDTELVTVHLPNVRSPSSSQAKPPKPTQILHDNSKYSGYVGPTLQIRREGGRQHHSKGGWRWAPENLSQYLKYTLSNCTAALKWAHLSLTTWVRKWVRGERVHWHCRAEGKEVWNLFGRWQKEWKKIKNKNWEGREAFRPSWLNPGRRVWPFPRAVQIPHARVAGAPDLAGSSVDPTPNALPVTIRGYRGSPLSWNLFDLEF